MLHTGILGEHSTSGIIIDSATQVVIDIALPILAIIIGALVAVVIFLKSRSRKLVTYKILTQERLLSVSSELKNKLKIFYESKEVEDVTLFKIEITNSGNKEILEKDYDRPITVAFGEKSQILSTELTECKPSPFPIALTSDGKVIVLSKTLLNAGDSITLKALVSKPQFYNVDGRIVGGKIQHVVPKTQSPNFPWFVISIVALLGLVGIIFSVVFNFVVLGVLSMLFLFVPVGVAFLVVIAQSYDYFKSKFSK